MMRVDVLIDGAGLAKILSNSVFARKIGDCAKKASHSDYLSFCVIQNVFAHAALRLPQFARPKHATARFHDTMTTTYLTGKLHPARHRHHRMCLS